MSDNNIWNERASMARIRLTDRYINGLKPKDKRYDISDSTRIGLRIRIATSGLKTWVFEKRIRGGKLRSHVLGRFPAIGLSEAREIALDLEREAYAGIDRKAEKKQQKTVQSALQDYNELHLSNLKTGKERFCQLSNALTPYFDQPLSELTRGDLQSFVDQKAHTGALYSANRHKAALSGFAGFVWRRGYTDLNIGAGLANAVVERPRDRVLKIEEIKRIYHATEFLAPVWRRCIRLLILTAQRRGDIAGLLVSELQLDKHRFVLSAPRTKNGKAHIVHLSKPALHIIEKVKPNNELLFTTTGRTPVSGFSKVKKDLDKLLPDIKNWRFHDFRTAFATAMAEAGEAEGVVDRILNHSASSSSPSAVARVYNQSQQLKQRAEVLDRWAKLVLENE